MTEEFKTPQWTFREIIQKGDKTSNPQSSREFDRLGHPHAEAGDPIANSLDAKSKVPEKDKLPVKVIYSIWDGKNSIPKGNAEKYFGKHLKIHVRNTKDTNDNSFKDKLKTFEKDMPFLLIEDFNTAGLEGDIDKFDIPWHDISKEEEKEIKNNRFLWFFRAQNATSDTQDRRGSWGEGKFTLEYASKLGAQITWSIRENSQPSNILMGQTTLRRHAIFDRKNNYGTVSPNGDIDRAKFDSYGYFSTANWGDVPIDYAPMPVTNGTAEGNEFISNFSEIFKTIRKNQPGTSILIADPVEEIKLPGSLARAILSRWIISIFTGQLEIQIMKNGKLIHDIKKESLGELISSLKWEDEPKKIGSTKNINPSAKLEEQWHGLLDLLKKVKKMSTDNIFETNPPMENSSPNWNDPFWDDENGEEKIKIMKNKFESGEMIKIIAKINVKKQDSTHNKIGKLHILLKKAPDNISTSLFARQGMTIPFMKSENGAIAIVHCMDDDPFSLILRHSEGPAHLEWSEKAPRVTKKAGNWEHGKMSTRFASSSVKAILRILKSNTVLESVALSMFSVSIPAPIENERKKSISGKDKLVIPPPNSRQLCRIPSKNNQGEVKINSNPELNLTSKKIKVNLAYETHKGNPWLKYNSLDFDKSNLEITTFGSDEINKNIENTNKKDGLVYFFEITSPTWKINFKGFDQLRDVAVEVTEA